jgi:hypothetical protein
MEMTAEVVFSLLFEIVWQRMGRSSWLTRGHQEKHCEIRSQ